MVKEDSKGPSISLKEFLKAMSEQNDKKATVIDGIPGKLLKNLDESMQDSLIKIIKDCYENEMLPTNFTKNKTITLPKKENASDCSIGRYFNSQTHQKSS